MNSLVVRAIHQDEKGAAFESLIAWHESRAIYSFFWKKEKGISTFNAEIRHLFFSIQKRTRGISSGRHFCGLGVQLGIVYFLFFIFQKVTYFVVGGTPLRFLSFFIFFFSSTYLRFKGLFSVFFSATENATHRRFREKDLATSHSYSVFQS